MDWFKIIVYGAVLLVLILVALVWLLYAFPVMALGGHRDRKYVQRGLCPRCKRPLSVRHVPPHQLRNRTPEQIEHLTCYCTHPPVVRVRRRRRVRVT